MPILGAFLVIGLGAGLFQAPNNTAQMSSAPRRWVGLASAITATGRNLGMVLGVSIGSVMLTTLLLAGATPGRSSRRTRPCSPRPSGRSSGRAPF